ncbi:hypothetical protein QBC39DRAFT_103447 [Podospora conica]|nr:hypothetical protein QBC39DRAFT_103447 [Schizothecium conicum]
MEKIIRQVRIAERVVARRTKKVNWHKKRGEMRQERFQLQMVLSEAHHHLKEARKARREAWELGPLAPRRDISHVGVSGAYYGSLTTEHAGLATKILSEDQKRARVAWCGTPGFVCLEEGDRVVVLDGPFRNVISRIRKVNKDNMTVTLDQNTHVNQTLPEFIGREQAGPVEPWDAPIPISSVRLVHPLRDPATGSVRDVIVRELRPFNRDYDRPTRKWTFDRVIPGENVVIPWPAKHEPKKETHPSDTVWADVDERTFVPTLLSPPMPETVLDELRSKYSRYRTRHTREYIAKREAQEAAKKASKRRGATADGMLLPVQEFNRQRRAERRARGQPELSEEVLARIGEVMEKNLRLRGKGLAPETIEEAVAQMSIRDGPEGEDGEQPRP